VRFTVLVHVAALLRHQMDSSITTTLPVTKFPSARPDPFKRALGIHNHFRGKLASAHLALSYG
jgi:hypothetical protein